MRLSIYPTCPSRCRVRRRAQTGKFPGSVESACRPPRQPILKIFVYVSQVNPDLITNLLGSLWDVLLGRRPVLRQSADKASNYGSPPESCAYSSFVAPNVGTLSKV